VDILEGLNPAQKEAVTWVEGPLLIIAGPGSGKTRVIAHRVAYLVKVVGIPPRRIMAVTFTNKAAGEMRERLLHLLGGRGVEELSLGTFHALASRILRQDGDRIGLDRSFVIYDEEDQLSLVKRALQELDLDIKNYPPKAIQGAIEAAKSQLLTWQSYPSRHYYEEIVKRVYEKYEALLKENRALDFEDLLMKAVFLFQEQPRVLVRYQERYLHILVDEFQDTNITQYGLAKLLAGKHRNICVVGDPDQSIYSWRFADIRNILSFEKDFPEARVVVLEQNYRSTQTILEVASHIIARNRERKPKDLWTENETGLPVKVLEADSPEEEAQLVAAELEKLTREGLPLKECAVMYRTNAQSRPLEEAFLRYGIPYQLVGAVRFYHRKEVKDLIAYLRLIHNPQDSVSLARVMNVPGRGIGPKTVDALSQWAQLKGIPLYQALKAAAEAGEEGPPLQPRARAALASFVKLLDGLREAAQEKDLVELLDLILEGTGFRAYLLGEPDGEDRWENVLELRTVAQEYSSREDGLQAFLEGVSLVSDQDNFDEKADRATLITLHQAKGLEFGAVFLVGMEEGLLPHFRSFDDPAQMEEERRLCYVGVTRARKYLYLVRARRRSIGGVTGPALPSRYLDDIPPHLVLRTDVVEASAVAQPRPPRLKAGDHVKHAVFGEGVVVAVASAPAKGDQEVTVVFKGAGLKRLLPSFAPLEKVGLSKRGGEK
jgi:DNA helicase-2/ATP-dependent DNA helicase PcrA